MASGDQYTGRTIHEALIKATLATCKPCCGGGSGSGDGSGGGGPSLAICCGCTRFPDTLAFTVTASCLGTKTGVMAKVIDLLDCDQPLGILLAYAYYEESGHGYTASGFECDTGDPVGLASPTVADKVFSIQMQCVTCTDAPFHQWWLIFTWYDYSGGVLKNIQALMPMDQPTCSPIVFANVNKTTVCFDARTSASVCYYGGYLEPYVFYTACEGSSFIVDISA